MTALPDASTARLPIYPYYCRSLSLTLGRWCPLTAVDVYALEEVAGFAGQDIYFWKNHMIKYVRLTGVIVAVDEYLGRVNYTLDDSSGVNIEVTCKAPPPSTTIPPDAVGEVDSKAWSIKAISGPTNSTPQKLISPDGPDLTNIDVGSVVKVKGGVGIFREQKQIRLKVITLLGETNAEVKCWKDVTNFKRDVLSTPWVVSGEEEEKCRLEEDREARWKMEEEAKRKRDDLRRHLRQKARELRDKQRAAGGQESYEEDRDKDHGREEKRQKRRKECLKSAADAGSSDKRHETSRVKSEKPREGLNPESRVNYPSKAARRRAAGKYDALGI